MLEIHVQPGLEGVAAMHVGQAVRPLYGAGIGVPRTEVVAADIDRREAALADHRLGVGGVGCARLIVARIGQSRIENRRAGEDKSVGAGNIVGGHIAVAGMARRAGGAGVLVVHAGEAIGVVSNRQALGRGKEQIRLPQVDIIVQAARIGGEVLLQRLEGLLRERVGREPPRQGSR